MKSNYENYSLNSRRKSKQYFEDRVITMDAMWRSYDLLPSESSKWAMYTKGPKTRGIQLLTVYKADAEDWSHYAYRTILTKAEDILVANDFLMGSLVVTNVLKLVVKPEKMLPRNFIQEEVVDPKVFLEETPYLEKCKILGDFKVQFAIKAFETDGALAKIYILRDHEEITEAKHIGIILSVNHIIADGATIFNLFRMFDKHCEVRTLDRTSVPDFTEELKETTRLHTKNGGDIFVANTIMMAAPMMIKTFTRGKSGDKKYIPFLRNYRINESEINASKDKYNTKNFWVSTNDILTHWLFKKRNRSATFVMMMVDLRQRLESLDHDLAGNYMSCINLKLKDLKSPKTIRECLVSRTHKEKEKSKHNFNVKSNPKATRVHKIRGLRRIPDVQSPPNFAQLLHYLGGISSNWTSFYSPVRLEGLRLQYQLPFIDERQLSESRMFGFNLAIEDQMIIFKVNEYETGVFITSGSGSISPEDLEKDPMLNGKIM